MLDPTPVAPVRESTLDIYLPAGHERAAGVVLHGGPVPMERRPTPRFWPVYQGYGSAAAQRGLVGGTFDHRFHDFGLIREAAQDISEVVNRVRRHPRVEQDRIAVWFFSGGGVLMGNWLRKPPSWLRCVAASYPIFPTQQELGDVAIAPSEALPDAGELPILLVRPGQEQPDYAERTDVFVSAAEAARANIEIIDVPNGHHAFDIVDHNEQSRAAVEEAFDWVAARLGR